MPIDPTLLQGDIVGSAVEKLQAALLAAGMIGPLVGVDVAPGPFTDGWVFAGADNDNRPSKDVTSTGKAALVVSSRSHWTTNVHNTARFPILQVLIFADSTRVAGSTSRAAEDSDLKVKKIAKVVRKCFHDAANADHSWPNDVWVTASVADGDLSIDDVPGSDGVSRGLQRFNLQVAD
jgi:hypothetical protein